MPGRQPGTRRSIEQAFLPAALEILATPASPLGRAIIWSIVGLFVAGIAWAALGRLDVVAVAPGRLVPSDGTKSLQSYAGGVVAAIRVREGDLVRRGQLLIELDPGEARADRDRIDQEIAAATTARRRLQALLNALDSDQRPVAAPGDWAEGGGAAAQWRLLLSEHAAHRAERELLEAERVQVGARAATLAQEIARLESGLPLLASRVAALRELSEQSLAPRLQYLELAQEHADLSQKKLVLLRQREELGTTLRQIEARQVAQRADRVRQWRREIADLTTRLASLGQELIKAEQRLQRCWLRAPIAGQVLQLAVGTVGGVVSPAQQLLRIAPRDRPLEIEAWVENADIGFVEPGQRAAIKLDAFPFTRYGTLDGRVLTVSGDTVEHGDGTRRYLARVAIAARPPDAVAAPGGRPMRPGPGMSAVVEFRLGQRSLLEYLLSPLVAHLSEAARER